MTKFLPALLILTIGLAPLRAASSNDARNTVMVDVDTARGKTSIPLVRKGDGFVGPRGEYYPTFPSKKTLEAVYGGGGSWKSPTPTPGPTATPKKTGGDVKMQTFDGGVKLWRDGRFLREIRTARPDIRGWKLVREQSQIVIKSGIGREPGVVELYDVNTGERLGRIKSTDVKDGKPAWAKNFAE